MGELVGDKVYERFGHEFPLLIKFLDTTDMLSLQVHPDDATAAERHHAFGKTEMWYVMAAEADSQIAVGFSRYSNLSELLEHIKNNSLQEILNLESAKAGDAYFIPAGTLHAIGKNITLAEIQQTSDITYRVYDWGRDEKNRPLHTDLAMDIIDYRVASPANKTNVAGTSGSTPLFDNKYFTSSYLSLSQATARNHSELDSFVLYICTEGAAQLRCSGQPEKIEKGETLLVPASLSDIQIAPQGSVELLEVYIRQLP
jgi:mannose-6-phosphate isomerase